MDQNILISAWQATDATPKSNMQLKLMIQERRHPVLIRIRRQFLIETLAFTAFLFVYYDFFDGNHKSVLMNAMLVGAMLLVIAHNIIGYVLAKRRMEGSNIIQSLQNYISKIKIYAVVSVASRALMAGCLLFFFTSVITFNANKYWILIGAIVVLIVQLALLSGIWFRRIKQIKESIDGFTLD